MTHRGRTEVKSRRRLLRVTDVIGGVGSPVDELAAPLKTKHDDINT